MNLDHTFLTLLVLAGFRRQKAMILVQALAGFRRYCALVQVLAGFRRQKAMVLVQKVLCSRAGSGRV